MIMVCPQCKGTFDGVLQCPKCGVRLMLATEKGPQLTQTKQGKWHQTPPGRIMAGLVLGLGLSYGLLLFVTRLLKMESLAPQASVFIFLGIQAVALAAGGMLAGAGQTKGILFGAGVLVLVLKDVLVARLVAKGPAECWSDRPDEVDLDAGGR